MKSNKTVPVFVEAQAHVTLGARNEGVATCAHLAAAALRVPHWPVGSFIPPYVSWYRRR